MKSNNRFYRKDLVCGHIKPSVRDIIISLGLIAAVIVLFVILNVIEVR